MKIVVLDGYAANPGDLCWEGLKALGECTIYDRTAPEKVLERATGAEAILTNKVVITAEHIAALPQLKYIGVLATGYNIIDIDAAQYTFCGTNGICTYPEHHSTGATPLRRGS